VSTHQVAALFQSSDATMVVRAVECLLVEASDEHDRGYASTLPRAATAAVVTTTRRGRSIHRMWVVNQTADDRCGPRRMSYASGA
jgi:hypothetical protein